jgi:hypothetical protein
MSPRRLALAFLAVFAGLFAADNLNHSMGLKAGYVRTSDHLWRPEPDRLDHLRWALGGQLLAAAAFAVLWVAFLKH